MRHLRLIVLICVAIFFSTTVYLDNTPRRFDPAQWRADVAATRASIQTDLSQAMSGKSDMLTPEREAFLAQRLEHSAMRLHLLCAQVDRARAVDQADQQTARELRLMRRAVLVVERLHRSRAAISDTERRTSVAAFHTSDPAHADLPEADGLVDFWRRNRPWIAAELEGMRKDTAQNPVLNTQAFENFQAALEGDIERVTQAALAAEIRRVDVWIDWAARQPSTRLSSMKQIAIEQVARLETIATTAKNLKLQPDPRLNSLHRDLRRMASVSSPTKWE